MIYSRGNPLRAARHLPRYLGQTHKCCHRDGHHQVGRPAWRTERIAARILGPVASPPSTRSTSDRRGGALDVAHAGAARSGEPRRTARRPERENNQTVDQTVAYALVGDDQPTAADAARCLSGRTFGGLTRRQVEVLRLVALAHSNREIAAALVLSEKTVERHLSHIFAKLQVSSRTGATRVAVQAGIA